MVAGTVISLPVTEEKKTALALGPARVGKQRLLVQFEVAQQRAERGC